MTNRSVLHEVMIHQDGSSERLDLLLLSVKISNKLLSRLLDLRHRLQRVLSTRRSTLTNSKLVIFRLLQRREEEGTMMPSREASLGR